ncbi:MAG: hypothetical protein C4326_00420 [Ignavibacteria bacterium]
MAIDKIGFGRPLVPSSENPKNRESHTGSPDAKDTVQLSGEALKLFAAARAQRLAEIQERVRTGFYDRPEITEKVVEGLLRDIKRPPTA